MIRRLFFDHPASVGESYAEHFAVASRFGWRMIAGGAGCALHAALPFVFRSVGSDTIQRLHGELVAKRRAVRAERDQMMSVDYVI